MEVARRDEISLGKATIYCNLDGTNIKEYEIEIEKIFINNDTDNKSMLIKVKDQELLDKTGGIIQGMSGSPVIQNGKFIGAITNVLVNDPTQGYAVFGDIMIKEMRE
jgi:stage IV sporulation protein B